MSTSRLPMNQVPCRNSPCTNVKCGFKHEPNQQQNNTNTEMSTPQIQKDERITLTPLKPKVPRSEIPCRNNPCTNSKCGFKHDTVAQTTPVIPSTSVAPPTPNKMPMSETPCRNNPCNKVNCGFKHLPNQVATKNNKTVMPMKDVPCRNNPCTNKKKCGFKHESVGVCDAVC